MPELLILSIFPARYNIDYKLFFYLILSRCAPGRNLVGNNSNIQRLWMVKMHIGWCYLDLPCDTLIQQRDMHFLLAILSFNIFVSFFVFILSLVRFVVSHHLFFLFNLVLQKELTLVFILVDPTLFFAVCTHTHISSVIYASDTRRVVYYGMWKKHFFTINMQTESGSMM